MREVFWFMLPLRWPFSQFCVLFQFFDYCIKNHIFCYGMLVVQVMVLPAEVTCVEFSLWCSYVFFRDVLCPSCFMLFNMCDLSPVCVGRSQNQRFCFYGFVYSLYFTENMLSVCPTYYLGTVVAFYLICASQDLSILCCCQVVAVCILLSFF